LTDVKNFERLMPKIAKFELSVFFILAKGMQKQNKMKKK
jgi:hypothetical protein